MSTETWFRCFPSRILGRLAGLDRYEGHIYLVVLLRFYEVGRPCTDTVSDLSVRTGIKSQRIISSIESLVAQGLLVRSDGGLIDPDNERRVAGCRHNIVGWSLIRARILDRDSRVCTYCCDDATQVDHIIPISRGGSSDDDNLTAACIVCNTSKGALTPDEWARRDGITFPKWGS
jgi:hypothetical protein